MCIFSCFGCCSETTTPLLTNVNNGKNSVANTKIQQVANPLTMNQHQPTQSLGFSSQIKVTSSNQSQEERELIDLYKHGLSYLEAKKLLDANKYFDQALELAKEMYRNKISDPSFLMCYHLKKTNEVNENNVMCYLCLTLSFLCQLNVLQPIFDRKKIIAQLRLIEPNSEFVKGLWPGL